MKIDLVKEKKVLLNLKVPPLHESTVYRSHSITPRAANSHAHVNSGMAINVDTNNAHTIQGRPIIAFGGISDTFVSSY